MNFLLGDLVTITTSGEKSDVVKVGSKREWLVKLIMLLARFT